MQRKIMHMLRARSSTRVAPNEDIYMTVIALGGLFFGLFQEFIGGPSRDSLSVQSRRIVCFALVVWFCWRLFWLLRLERCRFAAIGKDRWLARVQPVTFPFEMTIPSSLIWHINWVYLSPVFIAWFMAWFPLLSLLVTSARDLLGWALFVFWLLLIIIPAPIVYFSTRSIVRITRSGLTSENGRGSLEKTVNWSEAVFFVCYRLPRFLGGKETLYYELSSQKWRLSWRWVLDPRSPFIFWKPSLPPEEYHQQMQILCALIVEKTGLPLYDLTQAIKGENG